MHSGRSVPRLDYTNGTNIDSTYTYDDVGNRLTMLTNGQTHTYDYNDIYQITHVDYPDGYGNGLIHDKTFDYDAAGNRASVSNGGTVSYATNNLNQYTTVGVLLLYEGGGILCLTKRVGIL